METRIYGRLEGLAKYWGLYRDNGKENGNYNSILGLYRGYTRLIYFPKFKIPFLGIPITRTITFWGLYWGPLFWESSIYHGVGSDLLVRVCVCLRYLHAIGRLCA